MVTQPAASTSISDRPVGLRIRADLDVRRQKYNGQTYWVVKDPLSLRYYRFKPEEYEIVRQLDGKASLGEIQRRFNEEFAPQYLALHELLSFLGQLHGTGLAVSDTPGQGEFLWQRRRKNLARQRWQQLTNPLAIRIPTFDPQRLLDRLYPALSFCFSNYALAGGVLLMLAALLLVLARFDEFRARGVSVAELLAVENWGWLMLAISGVKVLHEFGHALTARHFRCECHEMGVMLLCFSPTIYTNVTDTWLLPNKWNRMAVAAAGIYVELVIAAAATFVWWFAPPGPIRHLSLILMLTCSVFTVVANGNPLVKYDGYYVFMDWMEIPNLRDKSRKLLLNLLARIGLGIEPPPDAYLTRSRQASFLLYAVASVGYGWFLFFLVLAFFLGHGLPPEARGLGLLVAGTLLWNGALLHLVRFFKWLRVPGRRQQIHQPNVIASAAFILFALAALWTIPVSETAFFPLTMHPAREETVIAPVTGRLQQVDVEPGRGVTPGDRLLTIRTLDDRRIVAVASRHAGLILPAPVAAAADIRPGRSVRKGDVLCRIGDRLRPEAWLEVSPRALRRLRLGQAVTIRVDIEPGILRTGMIAAISRRDFPTDTAIRPELWIARVPLEGLSDDWPIGCRGKARIRFVHRSLGHRLGTAILDIFREA